MRNRRAFLFCYRQYRLLCHRKLQLVLRLCICRQHIQLLGYAGKHLRQTVKDLDQTVHDFFRSVQSIQFVHHAFASSPVSSSSPHRSSR